MHIIQLTGLSGSGKSTISEAVQSLLEERSINTAIIDGDVYRKTISKDLGFSKEDRVENIRRLGKLTVGMNENVVIIAAINPFEEIRKELKEKYEAKTVWLKCDVETLKQRDTKGLYSRAMLPDGHPEKIHNLTGVNDPYEEPLDADLVINTGTLNVTESVKKLFDFIFSLRD